jgi:hypothetical protein
MYDSTGAATITATSVTIESGYNPADNMPHDFTGVTTATFSRLAYGGGVSVYPAGIQNLTLADTCDLVNCNAPHVSLDMSNGSWTGTASSSLHITGTAYAKPQWGQGYGMQGGSAANVTIDAVPDGSSPGPVITSAYLSGTLVINESCELFGDGNGNGAIDFTGVTDISLKAGKTLSLTGLATSGNYYSPLPVFLKSATTHFIKFADGDASFDAQMDPGTDCVAGNIKDTKVIAGITGTAGRHGTHTGAVPALVG